LVNRVFLIGRLTADPEVKATPAGTYVANMRLATNTYAGKDEDGNSKKQTEFHQLVAFGKKAEFAGQYLRKGRQVFAEGRLKTNTWTDSAGQKHYRTEIVIDELRGLGDRPQAEEAA
jgi:single-strand DNA-binding protein